MVCNQYCRRCYFYICSLLSTPVLSMMYFSHVIMTKWTWPFVFVIIDSIPYFGPTLVSFPTRLLPFLTKWTPGCHRQSVVVIGTFNLQNGNLAMHSFVSGVALGPRTIFSVNHFVRGQRYLVGEIAGPDAPNSALWRYEAVLKSVDPPGDSSVFEITAKLPNGPPTHTNIIPSAGLQFSPILRLPWDLHNYLPFSLHAVLFPTLHYASASESIASGNLSYSGFGSTMAAVNQPNAPLLPGHQMSADAFYFSAFLPANVNQVLYQFRNGMAANINRPNLCPVRRVEIAESVLHQGSSGGGLFQPGTFYLCGFNNSSVQGPPVQLLLFRALRDVLQQHPVVQLPLGF